MDALTISAASGMRARLESLEMLANNLANADTAGFKLDRESYSLYSAQESSAAGAPDPSTLPVVERHWTDFGQGQLSPTGSPTDLALASPGFFGVNGPNGALYTRNGSFRISAAGALTTPDGFPIRATGGGTIQLQPGVNFDVAADGTVKQGGAIVGTLEITDFNRPEAMAKSGRGYFRADASAGARPAANIQVQQGKLEGSNVAPPESAVRLVNLMRQFEMLQKAALLGGDMGKKAIEEVARVTS